MKRRITPILTPLILWTTILLAPAAGAGQEPPTVTMAEPKLEVVFLANEGFLLRSGGRTVLIDAFVTEPYAGYGALPSEVYQRMLAGEPPFEQVQLALASHVHRDHFQPEAAGAFLEKHPETLFASSPQVIEALRDGYEGSAEIEDRLRVVWPDSEQTETLERDGIRVDFFRLSHGTGRHAEIQNLGHVIELGGKKTLHLGDAEIKIANFEPFGLRSRELDVAIIPYWYYPQDHGRYLASEYFHAEHEIAAHVQPAEVENIFKGFRMEVTWVVVPQEAMESWSF
ncbi:MAG: MBL fold metallo-hydrolase [Thermoanaerobaculia bacterium]